MDEDEVKEKETIRKITLEYCFDRMSIRKISRAYELLAPIRNWPVGFRNGISGEQNRGDANEDGDSEEDDDEDNGLEQFDLEVRTNYCNFRSRGHVSQSRSS